MPSRAKSDRGEGLNLKALPDFPQIDLLTNQEEYFNRISAFMKPTDSKVPGASGAFLNKQMATAAEETRDLTRSVAMNTAKTADALSFRRQSIGGGTLAAAGVTPAEMRGGGGGGGFRSGGSGGQSFDAVGGDIAKIIERAVDAKVRAILSRQSGNGGFPR